MRAQGAEHGAAKGPPRRTGANRGADGQSVHGVAARAEDAGGLGQEDGDGDGHTTRRSGDSRLTHPRGKWAR